MKLILVRMQYVLLLAALSSTAMALNKKSSPVIFIDKAVTGIKAIPGSGKTTFQLISHGRPGQLLLNGQWRNATQIASFILNKKLIAPGVNHINIYGCEFAKGQIGLDAVHYLEQQLHVTVSASTNITGKDGDWKLEVGDATNVLSLSTYAGNLQCSGGGVIGGMGPNDDFDGDGICNAVDIDDDNDGIPDFMEMSTSTSLFTPKSSIIITTQITYTFNGAFTLQNLVDGSDANTNGTHVIINPSGTLAGTTWLKFEMPTATVLNLIELGNRNGGSGLFTITSKYNIEGSNNNTTWTTIAANQFYSFGAPIFATNSSAKFSMPLNITAYKYYRIQGISGAGAGDWAQEAYFRVVSATDIDTDGDGIPNRFDLDSDGDGCSDALEAGATTNTTANYQFTGNVGTNGLADILESSADNGILSYPSTYQPNALSSFIRACKDSDGDGINDLADIDDDNDGIPNATEAPTCYYSAFEANTISKITSSFFSADDSQTDGDIQTLHDGLSSPTFSMNTLAANNITGSMLFNIEYPIPVDIATLVISNPITNSASGTAVVKGSNNGQDWSVALSPQTSVLTTPITFVITTNTKYKYYRVETGTTTFTFIGTIDNIFSNLDANYVPSANPKGTCTTDTDGDGIINQLDLDSDGDGCSDLAESNVYPRTDVITPAANNNEGTSYGIANPAASQLNPAATDVNNDGLNDSVDGDLNSKNDNLLYYNTYATNSSLHACTDTDGDGVADLIDVDDDNDGILDVIEQPGCITTTADNCGSSRGSDAFIVWNSGIGTNFWKGTISYNGQAVGVTLSQDDGAVMLNDNSTDFDNAQSGGNSFCPSFPGTHANPHINSASKWKLTFSSPIKNPRFHFWSFGSGSGQAPMLFNGTYPIVKISHGSGTDFNVNNATHGIDGITTYAQGTIEMKTELDEIVFSTTQAENFWSINVSLGADNINSCVSLTDTDNDGIPNNLDLDSDGDGCPDAVEAGVAKTTGGPAMQNGVLQNGNHTGTVTTTQNVSNAVVAGPYGANGFANSVETSAESAIYNSSYTYNLAIDGTPTAGCNSVVLAAYWLSVGAILKNEDGIVTWKVTEKNVKQYIVQRSVDGVNFTNIGTVNAFNSSVEKQYSYTDSKVTVLNMRKVFYRILSVDFDLSRSYSKVVSINVLRSGTATPIVVYPNPNNGVLNFNTLAGVKSIDIFNMQGALVKRFAVANSSVLTYSLPGLPSGIYGIRLITNSEPVYLKVDVVR